MTTRVLSARTVIGVLVLSALTAVSAGAQARATSADLSGIVRDPSKAVLPGATVTATNAATGVTRVAVTGRDGRYSIAALPPATYSITVTAAGFAPREIDDVVLAVGQAADLPVTLALAGATESVTVAAQSRLADVRETALATVITQEQIDALPTNGRSFLSFSLLTPGVNTDRVPVMAVTPTSGLTFAGQRARSNNVTVDGLDNNDVVSGSVRAAFSQEAVQEFQVLANSFSAEFGKASGGVVNIVTRSGGNKVAGTLFGYFRDEALNAKEHFEEFDPAGGRLDRSKAPYSQYQFGGVLGGPIRRNRSFFFLSAERLKVRANNYVNIPTDVATVLQQAGFPVELGQVPYRFDSDQLLGKIDWNLAANHRLTLRVNWARLLDDNAEPWGGLVARSRGASLDSRDVMGAALLTSTLSPRTVNELRLQLAYRDQQVISLDPRCTGACDQNDEGGPAVDVGATKVGRSVTTPHPFRTLSYYVVDTLTHQVGRHGLKAGFDVGYVGLRNNAFPFLFGGRYIFGPLGPLTDVQALALGRPYAYLQGYGNPSAPRGLGASDLSLFAEDEWRVRDQLTLKVGVRYQDQFFPKMTESVYGLRYDWPGDHDNLAPRIAVSWDPTGRGTTSVHGAYGVFYDNQIEGISAVVGFLGGTGDYLRVKIRPYPESIAGWNAPGRRLPEPATSYPSIMQTVDPRLETPFAHQASAGLQTTLAKGLSLSAHVVLVRGFDQVSLLEYNPITRPPNGRPLDVNGVPGTSSSVQQYTSWGETWYRGLTVSARKRFGRRAEVLASYTLSKAEDLAADTVSQSLDNGQGRNPADPMGRPLGFNPALERGPSLQDQRQRLVVSGTWALPRGFTASAIVTAGSGRPFNIIAGEDLNGDGDTGQTDRPRTVDGTPVGRNTGLLPATSSVDLRLAKEVRVGDRARLVLMAETFNLFNHTNYTQVDAVFGRGTYPSNPAPHFGEYTKAAPPFQAQLAAKVSF